MVAVYLNRPELVAKEGRRVTNLLYDNKIEFISDNSSCVTISVLAGQAPEALRLLATAIKAEHLRIQLIQMSAKGDWGIPVTPDHIMDPDWKL